MEYSIITTYSSWSVFVNFIISSSFKSINFPLSDKRYKKMLPDLIFYSVTYTEIEIEYDPDRHILIDFHKPTIDKSKEDYISCFDQSELDTISKCSLLENKTKYIISKLSSFCGMHKAFLVSLEKYPGKSFFCYVKYDNIKKWSRIVSSAYKKGKPVKIKLDLENEWILDIQNVNKFDDILSRLNHLQVSSPKIT